jgi:hypothetical protein
MSNKICHGLRPRFNIKVPQLIVHLIKRCLDANQLNRPMAEEIEDILSQWQYNSLDDLQKQIKEAEEINNNLSADVIPLSNLTYKTPFIQVDHLILITFLNQKILMIYYTQKENIISKEFSGINNFIIYYFNNNIRMLTN